MRDENFGYGGIDANSESARWRRRRVQMQTAVPVVTEQWLLEDRRDEALTCWPYRAGGR